MYINYVVTWHLFLCYTTELVIIWSFHGNIHIIIPWNKTMMSHCTKKCTPVSKILYSILFTYSINLHKHLHLGCPCFLHHTFYIKAISYLSFKISFWYLHNLSFLHWLFSINNLAYTTSIISSISTECFLSIIYPYSLSLKLVSLLISIILLMYMAPLTL